MLMKRGLVAGIDYDQDPGARHRHLPWVLATRFCCSPTFRPEARGFIAPLTDAIAGQARRWTSFAGFEDEVTDLELDGDDLYLLVNKGTPRGRIVKTSAAAPSIANGTVVVPQSALSSSKAPHARATACT